MIRTRLIVLATASVIALAGCSGGALVVEDAQSSTSQSGTTDPNLDTERIESVLAEVQEAVDAADQAQDASLLDGRVDEAALRVRQAQYVYAQASGDAVDPLDLSAQSIAITNSESWPRAILNITEGEASTLPVVEVLVQEDARSEYRLTNWARLLGSTQLTLASIESGSAYVGGDAEGLTMTPDEAIAAYVELLNSGSQESKTFTSDEFTKNYFETLSKLKASLEAAGSVSGQASTTEYPISGILTQDGSALVAANFTYTLTYQRTVAGSTMRLGGQTAILNAGDEDTVTGTTTVTYLATVLLRIPSAEAGGQIQVVGAERVIESIESDDSSNPDR